MSGNNDINNHKRGSLTLENIENTDLENDEKQPVSNEVITNNEQNRKTEGNDTDQQKETGEEEEEMKDETCCKTQEIFHENNRILLVTGSMVDFTLDWERSPDTLQNICLKPPQRCIDNLSYGKCGLIISISEDSGDLPHDDHVLRTFIDALKKVVKATNAIVTTCGRNTPVTCACNLMVKRLRNMKFTSKFESNVTAVGIDVQTQGVQEKILQTLNENNHFDANQSMMFMVQTNENLSALEIADTVESTERLLMNDPTCTGRSIPRVLVVYGGTINTLRRVFCAAKEKTRIIIIKGSGGLADVLSTVKPEKWHKMDSFLGKENKNEVSTLMGELQRILPEVFSVCDSIYSLGIYIVRAALRDAVQHSDKIKMMCRNIVENSVDLLSDLMDSEITKESEHHRYISIGDKVLDYLSWQDLDYLYKNGDLTSLHLVTSTRLSCKNLVKDITAFLLVSGTLHFGHKIPVDVQIRNCLIIDYSVDEETLPILRSVNKELQEIGINRSVYRIDFEDYVKYKQQKFRNDSHAKENGGNQDLQDDERNFETEKSSTALCGCRKGPEENSNKIHGENGQKLTLKKRPTHLDICAWYLLTEKTEGAKMLWVKSRQMTIRDAFVASTILDGLQKTVYGDKNINILINTSQEFIEHATNLLHEGYHLSDGSYRDKAQSFTETLLLKNPDGYMSLAYDLHKTAFFKHRSVKEVLQKKWLNSSIDNYTTLRLFMVLALRDLIFFPLLFFLFPVFVIFKPDIVQKLIKRLDTTAMKCLLHTISYVAFLLLYSYMILVDMNDFMTWIDFILIVWVICYGVDEIRQIYQAGGETIHMKLKSYATWYNIMDVLCITIFAIGMVLKSLPFDTFDAGRVTMAVGITLFTVRILNLTSLSLTLGPKSVMIRKMFVYDLLPFMVIMFVFLVAFSVADYSLLYPNSSLNWNLIENVLGAGYWILYGENNVEDFTRKEPDCSYNITLYESGDLPRCPNSIGKSVVPYIRAVFALISVVLLLNVLIAMFNDTYKRVQDYGKMHWIEEYRCLVAEYESKPLFPPPFAALLIPHLILLMILWFCTSPLQLLMNKDDTISKESQPSKIDFFFRLYLYGENKYEEFDTRKMKEELSEFEKHVKVKYRERLRKRSHIKENKAMDEVQEIRTKTDRLTRQLYLQGEETRELRRVTKDLTKRVEDLMNNFDNLVKMMGRRSYRLSWGRESSTVSEESKTKKEATD